MADEVASEIGEQLVDVEKRVRKLDKVIASIALGKNGVPVDMRTINIYLQGEVRNEEFGNQLLAYLERCAVNAPIIEIVFPNE